MNDLHSTLGPGGYIALLAGLVHLIVRLLRTDKFNAVLARFKLPAVPRGWLPVLALVLGVLGSVLDRVVAGVPWRECIPAAIEGLIAGAFAIAGYEVGPKSVQRVKRTRKLAIPAAPDAEPEADEPAVEVDGPLPEPDKDADTPAKPE